MRLWMKGVPALMASPALAFSLSPANTAFVSTGHAAVSTVSLSANCAVRFAGRTDAAGVGHITEAAFSGGPLGGCGAIHATGLPWTMLAVAPGHAEIGLVSVHSSLFGDCAGRDVAVTISPTGVIGFPHVPLPPKCAMKGGSAATKPAVRAVR